MSTIRFAVSHESDYRYSGDVSLAYNRAHLLPRSTGRQRVEASALSIDPPPDDRWDDVDPDGNLRTYFTIERPHDHLTVTALSELVIDTTAAPVSLAAIAPWEDATTGRWLAPHDHDFVLDTPLVERSAELAAYALPSFPPGRCLVDGIGDLTARLHGDLTYLPGSTTVTTSAAEVLRHRQGVCQDFAHLALGCLRSIGLPSRYVSGYLESAPPDGGGFVGAAASHAWVAVRLPDGSWLDADPTNNLVDPATHVTVAWGRDYGDVAPLSGVVFAEGVGSTLSVAVHVERRPGPGGWLDPLR